MFAFYSHDTVEYGISTVMANYCYKNIVLLNYKNNYSTTPMLFSQSTTIAFNEKPYCITLWNNKYKYIPVKKDNRFHWIVFEKPFTLQMYDEIP